MDRVKNAGWVGPCTLFAVPLLVAPLLLLALGMGNAATETVQAACTRTAAAPTSSAPTPGAPETMAGGFGIGTLNWRGASHYRTNPYPGERPPLERVPNMVSKIGASGASILGFQEFEPAQAEAFLDATGGQWSIVSGRVRGQRDTRNAVAYQPAVWTVDETRYLTINYGGNPVDIPLVRLAATPAPASTPVSDPGPGSPATPSAQPTGGSPSGSAPGPASGTAAEPGPPAGPGAIWVLNTHNPADAVGGTDTMRDSAVRAQAHALAQLRAVDPTTPLLFVGDMNDRARFKQLFLQSAGPGWSAANPTDHQVDWIIGSPGVTFAATVVDTATNDKAHRYTDHPFVHTTVNGNVTGATASPVVACGSQPNTTTGQLTTQLPAQLSAQVAARMASMLQTAHGLCALSWTRDAPCTYDNQCPKVVDALYGGPGTGRGYGNGKDVAQAIINNGLAQAHGTGLDPLPPIGAVVSFNTGNRYGHVAIYVGNGQIFGNDYGCASNGLYGCVGFADIHAPGGSITWALPTTAFDLAGMPRTAA